MSSSKKIAILTLQQAESLSSKAQQELQILKKSLQELGSQFSEFTGPTLSSIDPQQFGGIVIIADSHVLPFNEELKSLVLRFYDQFNPIGVIGIASLVAAESLSHLHPTLTIANDPQMINELKKYGCYFEPCPVNDYITDRDTRVISTPGNYITDASDELAKGISGLAKELVEMA